MRRQILVGVCVSLVAVLSASFASQAGAVSGTTLAYKKTTGGAAYRTIVARTARGRIAGFGYPRIGVYTQYDGGRFWFCEVGEKCQVFGGAPGKKGGELLENQFFKPYGKNGATSNVKDHKPSGKKTIAGVPSSCESGHDPYQVNETATFCVSRRGGFLTLLATPHEKYELKAASSRVSASFLAIPSGVWNGHFPG